MEGLAEGLRAISPSRNFELYRKSFDQGIIYQWYDRRNDSRDPVVETSPSKDFRYLDFDSKADPEKELDFVIHDHSDVHGVSIALNRFRNEKLAQQVFDLPPVSRTNLDEIPEGVKLDDIPEVRATSSRRGGHQEIGICLGRDQQLLMVSQERLPSFAHHIFFSYYENDRQPKQHKVRLPGLATERVLLRKSHFSCASHTTWVAFASANEIKVVDYASGDTIYQNRFPHIGIESVLFTREEVPRLFATTSRDELIEINFRKETKDEKSVRSAFDLNPIASKTQRTHSQRNHFYLLNSSFDSQVVALDFFANDNDLRTFVFLNVKNLTDI